MVSWIGGQHEFALPIGSLRAVQAACDAGPQEVLMRLAGGTWRVDDPLAVLQQGLIGGGMSRGDAGDLVNRMAELHGLNRIVVTAQIVLSAALIGVEDDPVGETPGEKAGQDRAPENGGSAPFTDLAPSPGSPLATSTA